MVATDGRTARTPPDAGARARRHRSGAAHPEPWPSARPRADASTCVRRRARRPSSESGTILEEGQPIGLIEVMKTFAHVRYAGAGLPPRGRVAKVLVEDGAEVGAGDPLIEIEPV